MKRFLLVASLAAALNATCIVGIVEKNQVILAADSLEAHPGRAPSRVCKIIVNDTGTAAAALDGLVGDQNTGFDLAAVARESLQADIELDRDVTLFRRAAMAALEQELGQQRIHAPQIYTARLSKHLVSALFAGLEHRQPVLWVKAYEAGPDGSVAEYRSNELHAIEAGRVIVLCEHAPALMRSQSDLRGLPAVELARTLVQLDIDRQPEEHPLADGPISVLRITPLGMDWIEQGRCEPPAHGDEEIGVAGEE